MIDIKIAAKPKQAETTQKTGIYGLGSTAPNSQTSTTTTLSDYIEAVSVSANYLNISTQGTITNLNSSYIKTDDISANKGHFSSYIETPELTVSYKGTVSDLTTTTLTSDRADIINAYLTNLTVSGQAHFFELVIDEIRAAGGQYILSAAQPFTVERLEYKDNTYYMYFLAYDGERQTKNTWTDGDMFICSSFNQVSVGNNAQAQNKYYWSIISNASTEPVSLDGKLYHYITWNRGQIADGVVNIEVGDNIAQLGNAYTPSRQNAIYIAAGETSLDAGLATPLIAQYSGINDFNLSSFRTTYLSRGANSFTGNFYVNANTTVTDYIDDKIEEIDTDGLKGKDGESAYYVVYSNQMINIPCDVNGNAIESEEEQKCTIRLFYGTNAIPTTAIVTPPSVSTPDGQIFPLAYTTYDYTFKINNSYVNSWDDCTTLTANFLLNDAKIITANIYCNKIKAGENGVTPTIYELHSTADFVKVNKLGEIVTPEDNIVVNIRKYTGSNFTDLTSLPAGMRLESTATSLSSGQQTTTTHLTARITLNASISTSYKVSLYKNNILADEINIPVIFDGENGTDGQDAQFDRLVVDKLKATVNLDGTLTLDINAGVEQVKGNTAVVLPHHNYKLKYVADKHVTTPQTISYNNQSRFVGTYTICYDYLAYVGNNSAPTYFQVGLYNIYDYCVDSRIVNVQTDAGATLEVNGDLQTISGTVQNNKGDISALKLTTQGLSSQVTTLGSSFSAIEQRADSIETTVKGLSAGGQNLIDRTAFSSIDDMISQTDKSTRYWYFHHRSLTGVSYHIEETNYFTNYPNTVVIDAYNAVSNGSEKYNDFTQALNYVENGKYVNKVKPYSYYTVSGWYRLDKNENYTATNSAGIYLTGGDFYSDGKKTTAIKILPVSSTWTKFAHTFYVDKYDANSNITIYLRCGQYYKLYLSNLKLEEGNIASAWVDSMNDRNSTITQTAENISLEVKDNLSRTGIDIENGKITLDADNTVIDGDLNITNSNEGLNIFDDNGNVAVQIQKSSIGEYNPTDFNITVGHHCWYDVYENGGNYYIGANTKFSFTTNKSTLGDFTNTDKISFRGLTVQGKEECIFNEYCKPNVTMYLYNNGTKVYTKTLSLTIDEYENYISADFDYDVVNAGKYSVDFLLEGTTATQLSEYLIDVDVSFTMLKTATINSTKIGVDGIVSSVGAGRLFWMGKDRITLKWFNADNYANNHFGLEINSNGIERIVGNYDNTLIKYPIDGYEKITEIVTPSNNLYPGFTKGVQKITDRETLDRYGFYSVNSIIAYIIDFDDDVVLDVNIEQSEIINDFGSSALQVYIILPMATIDGRKLKINNRGSVAVHITAAFSLSDDIRNLRKRGTNSYSIVKLSKYNSVDVAAYDAEWEYTLYN